MESGRRNLAPCAPPGSTARTAWRTTWLRILTSPWWPPPTSPLSGRTRARAAGTSCACSAPATARSSTTLAAKTAKGIRTRQFPFSPATPTARCDISIPRILGWPPTSKSAASISLLPSGTSWTSSRKAAATGTPVSTTAPKSRPPPRRLISNCPHTLLPLRNQSPYRGIAEQKKRCFDLGWITGNPEAEATLQRQRGLALPNAVVFTNGFEQKCDPDDSRPSALLSDQRTGNQVF